MRPCYPPPDILFGIVIGRRYVVTGQVQGVGFRMFTERVARHEGITGWVANRTDGGVDVMAEGEVDAIERFERRLRVGPPMARVAAVESADLPATGRWSGFETR